MIYDEIGMFGLSAAQVAAQLKGRKGPLVCRINSPGGDIFDGLAIYNLLRAYAGEVTICVDGLAASMASVIACAGGKVVMAEGSMMMLHNPSGLVIGESADMRQMADALDAMKRTLIAAYVRRSGKSAEEIAALMDAETWLTGAEAVAAGFADRCGKPVALSAKWLPGRATAAWNKAPDLSRFTAHLPAETPPPKERKPMSEIKNTAAPAASEPSAEDCRRLYAAMAEATGQATIDGILGAYDGLKASAAKAIRDGEAAQVKVLVAQCIADGQIAPKDRAHYEGQSLARVRAFAEVAAKSPPPTAAPQGKGAIDAKPPAAGKDVTEESLAGARKLLRKE